MGVICKVCKRRVGSGAFSDRGVPAVLGGSCGWGPTGKGLLGNVANVVYKTLSFD